MSDRAEIAAKYMTILIMHDRDDNDVIVINDDSKDECNTTTANIDECE